MEKILKYDSKTTGLWPRFFTKWIINLIVITLAIAFVITFFVVPFLEIKSIHIWILVLLLGGWLLWRIYKDLPFGWDNNVILDLEQQRLLIRPQRLVREEALLDFEGKTFYASDIDHFSTAQYESVLFSPYYLITIHARGKTIKLLSLNNANAYTEFTGALQQHLKLKLR